MLDQSFDVAMRKLRSFVPPAGWDGDIFLLPQDHMRDIYNLILQYQPTSCLELGTGFGATSCVIAAALERNGHGQLVTVDRVLHDPVNVNVLLNHVRGNIDRVETIVDELGYNWWLAEVLAQQTDTRTGQVNEIFDLCFLDGAHEWETDALAFLLAVRLLKPGGWMVLDDLNFSLRSLDWRAEYRDRSDRELDSFQIKMIFDLLLSNHKDFGYIGVSADQRMVWARKLRPALSLFGLTDRIKSTVRKRITR
mgnify:CR=1 FL=1